MDKPKIKDFKVRANYSNYNISLFFVDNTSKKNKDFSGNYLNPVIEYIEEGDARPKEITGHYLDLPNLNNIDKEIAKDYLVHLLMQQGGNNESNIFIAEARRKLKEEKLKLIKKTSFEENDYVVCSASKETFSEDLISQKGRILLNLIQELYPVPDFCVLTSKAFYLDEKEKNIHIETAIRNLEKMTGHLLGDSHKPLVFAMRCATSRYIPGLMPTYLNAGLNEKAYITLKKNLGVQIANKIYLKHLKDLYLLLFSDTQKTVLPKRIFTNDQTNIEKAIDFLYEKIARKEKRLLTDPYFQITLLVNKAYEFFRQNQDLIYTLKKGDVSYPAIIMQKMVWTILNDDSYPGVLYSRHSRTGLGMQIESVKNMFGDDIMTGIIDRTDTEFFDRSEIRDIFPAVYHFTPNLPKLEQKLESPVTIEFAAETYRNINSFAILQLNMSELTGRSSLLSAIDLFDKKVITGKRVVSLIQPYHLKQIFSERIDDNSFRNLRFFCRGISVLPRSAVSARIFFSASKALEAKGKGEKVCLCKETYVPSDTIILSELDAIISLTPAAVHVVTSCLGYGVPAFINLLQYDVKTEGNSLVNEDKMVVNEGDWITLSSKHKMIFTGKANYAPARFQKYLDGQSIVLEPKEEKVFTNMKTAYSRYQEIIKSIDSIEISSLNDLIKIIRNDLRKDHEKAKKLMNKWFDSNIKLYVEQVLKSDLGTHHDQYMIFDLLTIERKIAFFKNAIALCRERQLMGYTAGSFMIGRFICLPHSAKLWKEMHAHEIAFLLNEYILFEKYLQLLNELGERHINRARTEILKEGIDSINLSSVDPAVFMTLKLYFKNWDSILGILPESFDPETKHLISLLQLPFGHFYDYKSEWSLNTLKEICEAEGVDLPEATDI